jgi:hypothetical protein
MRSRIDALAPLSAGARRFADVSGTGAVDLGRCDVQWSQRLYPIEIGKARQVNASRHTGREVNLAANDSPAPVFAFLAVLT